MTYIENFFKLVSNMEITYKSEKLSYDDFIERIVKAFLDIRQNKKCVYFIGNGGSAAIANHMTADFLKNGRVQTIDFYSPATLTCLSNDFGYENVFKKQLESCGKSGDMLVAISSSGESKNIINALETAKNLGCEIFTLTGFSPTNKARTLGDFSLYVPSNEYGLVESAHNLVLQHIVDELKEC